MFNRVYTKVTVRSAQTILHPQLMYPEIERV